MGGGYQQDRGAVNLCLWLLEGLELGGRDAAALLIPIYCPTFSQNFGPVANCDELLSVYSLCSNTRNWNLSDETTISTEFLKALVEPSTLQGARTMNDIKEEAFITGNAKFRVSSEIIFILSLIQQCLEEGVL